MKRKGQGILKIFLGLTLFIFGLKGGALAETGWIKFTKKNDVYFRPFVDVRNPKNKLVIFVTEDGHIYRGRCRQRRVVDFCRVSPSKKFKDNLVEIRYIVLELVPPFAPKLVRSGTVERLNLIQK